MDPLLCPVLVGRDAELRAVEEAVDDAASGRGGALVLLGEAGSGKSRLLTEARTRATGRGLTVLHGRVLERGTAYPTGPFAEAVAGAFRSGWPAHPEVRPVRSLLERLTGEDAGTTPPPAPPALAEALLRLLHAAAAERGALLLVEDLHWADADTVVVLDYLLANTADHGAGCLVTLRPEPTGNGYRALRRAADTRAARLVELGPLDDGEVDRMVRACLRTDAVPGGLLRFVRDRADGMPFHVEELLAGLARSGALVGTDDGWLVVERRLRAAVPPTVADSVTARFATLHPRTRAVLQAAALLGRRIEAEMLPRVTGLTTGEVLASLREASYATFLTTDPDDGTLRFRHALTRDHIAASLLGPERSALARCALQVVTAEHPLLPDPWCAVGAHLAELAGEAERGAALLVELGNRERRRGALGTAAAHLERALELLAGTGAETLPAREDLAAVRALAGDVDAALALAGPALGERNGRSDDPDRAGALRLTLARALLAAGRLDEARRQLAGARASDPAAAVLEAQIDAAAGEPDRARARARDVLATPGVGPEVACEAWEVVGRADRLHDVEAAEHAFAAALDLAERHGLGAWRARALHELGTVDLLDTMRTDRLERARRVAVETGTSATLALVEFHLAEALVARGRLAAGREAALQAVAAARRAGSAVLAPALLTLARSYAHELDGDRMEAALDRARAAGRGDVAVAAGEQGRVRAMLALHQGDPAEARAALDRAVELLRAAPGHHFPHWGLWALLHALDGVDAEDAAAEAAAAPGHGTRFNRSLLQVARAVRAGRTTPGAAEALFAAGSADLAGYVDADWLLHLTRWLVAPAAQGDCWGDPVGWLQAAVRWFADHDRPRLATACRTRLRDAGGAVPRRGRGRSPVPDDLLAQGVTSREMDVLRLLGRRLTNRGIAEALVLSPRTVEKHVAGLLRKTGAADRAALAALAGEHLPVAGPPEDARR